jgi:hypothetical protein
LVLSSENQSSLDFFFSLHGYLEDGNPISYVFVQCGVSFK